MDFNRAVIFASRFYFEKVKGSIDAMNEVGLPAALVTADGKLRYSNNLFDRLATCFDSDSRGRLTLRANEKQCQEFRSVILQRIESGHTIVLKGQYAAVTTLVHIMPIACTARDIFEDSNKMILVVCSQGKSNAPTEDALKKTFGLTTAEARLVRTLSTGLSLRDSAAKMKI